MPDPTDVSLKEYFEAIQAQAQKAVEAALASQEKAVSAALAAANAATDKAEKDALRWRENANEWRQSMNDREAKFVNVDVFQEALTGIRADVSKANELAKELRNKKTGGEEMRVLIFACVLIVIVVAGFIIGL